MEYRHEEEDTTIAVGLETGDIVNLVKEITLLMDDSKVKNISHCIERVEDKTLLMEGEKRDRRIRLLHYLAFQHCAHLTESFVASILSSKFKTVVGIEGLEKLLKELKGEGHVKH